MQVSQPLMPLGVEHQRLHTSTTAIIKVSQPLMPLGVEHPSCMHWQSHLVM